MSKYPNVDRWASLARTAAAKHGVPLALVLAVMQQESGGDPYAYRAEPQISDASRGLMQLLSRTARALGYGGDFAPSDPVVIQGRAFALTGLWEPATNIGLGAKLLGQNLRAARPTHGDGALAVAVSAYNAGFSTDRPGDAKRTAAGAIVNQDYVNKVLSYMTDFEFADVASGAGSTAAPPAVTLDEIAPRAPSPTLPDIQRLPFEPVPVEQGSAFTGSWWLLLIGAALVAIAYLASRGR